MLENVSSLLTLNPVIVYSTLALYAVLFAGMFFYLHNRFRMASRVLGFLKQDWASAQSDHSSLVEAARERLATLQPEAPAQKEAVPMVAPRQSFNADTRTQVVAMGKRGVPTSEIARSTGLPEGEVDVLLGLARMQR